MRIEKPSRASVAPFLVLPLIAALAVIVAQGLDRVYPPSAQVLLVLIAAGVGLLIARDRVRLDPVPACALACALAYVVVLAASTASASGPAAGWWRVGLGLVACGVAWRMAGSAWGESLVILASASAVTALLALACEMRLRANHSLIPAYAFLFGHVNFLVEIVGPSLLAATAVIALRPRSVRLPLRVLVLAGIVALAFIAFETRRRGFTLAAVVSLLLVAGSFLRWRIVSWQHGLVLLALGTMTVFVVFGKTPPVADTRIPIYRAAVEQGMNHPWIGGGSLSALATGLSDGENGRRIVAFGEYPHHFHNELLEAFADGGVLGVLSVLGFCALLSLHIARVPDRVERLSRQVLFAAVMVHAATDPVYATDVGILWFGVVVGMLLSRAEADPAAEARDPAGAIGRCSLAAAGLLALVAAWMSTRSAFAPADTTANAHVDLASRLGSPLAVNAHLLLAVAAAKPSEGAIVERIAVVSGDRFGDPLMFAHHALGVLATDRRPESTRQIIDVIRRRPFDEEWYDLLVARAAEDPAAGARLRALAESGASAISSDDAIVGIDRAAAAWWSMTVGLREGRLPPVAPLDS
ncbi:MAG: O-antigen ligase family protein, partial [Planctomycetes bacterium]|nr:O-antigen ligase family protein [Planctomycetota bacterium]